MRSNFVSTRKKLAIFSAASSVALLGNAQGATSTWFSGTGTFATDGLWTTAGNWGGGIPAGIALFQGSASAYVTPNITGTTANFTSLNLATAGWTFNGTGTLDFVDGGGYMIDTTGTGTDTFNANIHYAGTTHNNQSITMATTGNTLLFNGTFVDTEVANPIAVSGQDVSDTLVFNASSGNDAYVGSLTNATLVFNQDNIFQSTVPTTPTITLGAGGTENITAFGSAHQIGNNLNFSGTGTLILGGATGYTSQNITINNTISTGTGANTETVTVTSGVAASAYGIVTGTGSDYSHMPHWNVNGAGTLTLTGGGSTESNTGWSFALGGTATLLVDGGMTNAYWGSTSLTTHLTNFTPTYGSGTTLSGIGTIDFGTGIGYVTNHTISGTLAPGDPAKPGAVQTLTFGTLAGGDPTYNPNSTANNIIFSGTNAGLYIRMNSTTGSSSNSEVVVNGTVALGTGTTLFTIKDSDLTAGTLMQNYTLLTCTALTGSFSNVAFGSNYLASNGDTYTITDPNGNSIVATEVATLTIASTWTNNATGFSWNNSGNWSSGIPNGQGASATFTTAGQGTVTLDAVQTVGAINFDSGTYIINAGAGGSLKIDNTGGAGGASIMTQVGAGATINANMNLAAGVSVNPASNTTVTINGVISGTGPLTVGGAGIVVLNPGSANTYTGGTTINAGTLQVDNANAIPAGSVTDNATLAFNFGSAVTFSNYIGGMGAIVQNGPGTLVLSGSNKYTGGTTINSGTVQIGIAAASGASALGSTATPGALTVNGGTLDLNGNNVTVGALSGSAGGIITDKSTGSTTTVLTDNNPNRVTTTFNGVIQDGSNGQKLGLTFTGVNQFYGVLALGGANTYTGSTTVTAGTIQINTGGSISPSSNVLLNGAAGSSLLAFNQTTNTSFSNTISGVGTVLQEGTGKTTLTGPNTFTGGVEITQGILSTADMENGGVTSPIGKATSAASNIYIYTGTLQYTGPTANTDRLFSFSNYGATIDASGTGPLNFTNTGAIGFQRGGVRTLTLTGSTTGFTNTLAPSLSDYTSGATSLQKTGTNTWSLSGTNSFSGSTTVTGGKLNITGSLPNTSIVNVTAGSIGGTGSIGPAQVTIAAGAAIDLVDSGIGTLSLGGNLTMAGASTPSNFNIEANSSGFDAVSVGGAYTDNGGGVIVNVTAISAPTVSGTPYNILVTNALLTGTFDFSNMQTTEQFGSVLLTLQNTGADEAILVSTGGAANSTWNNGSTDGNWNTAGNWQPAGVLTGAGSVANFTTLAAGSVNVDAAETVGKINIDSAVTPYVFTAGGGSITFDDTGDALVSPQINVNNGSHTINAPVILTTGLNVNFLNSSGLTVGGAITGTGPITVNGAGTLTVAATSGLLPSGSALSINTGALVALAASAHPLGSPAIQTVASIAFDGPSSKLDVGNNEVIDSTDSESVIRADIVAGNIYSSLTNFTYGVGEMPSGGGTEIRYTVIGDTNLDGVVNFTDLLNLASDYGMTGADWLQGDLNYDGTINFSDLLDLASNYGTSLTPGEATSNGISPSFAADWNLAVSEVSSVPEPTSIGLLAVGATGLLARRRRRA